MYTRTSLPVAFTSEHLCNTISMTHTLLTSVKPTKWQMRVNTWITLPLCHTHSWQVWNQIKGSPALLNLCNLPVLTYVFRFCNWVHFNRDNVTKRSRWLQHHHCSQFRKKEKSRGWGGVGGQTYITIVLSLERKKKVGGGEGWVDKQTSPLFSV